MVQSIENLFITHLYNTGIINGKTITELITIYTNIKKTSTTFPSKLSPKERHSLYLLNFKNSMCASLMYFLSNLTDEQTESISLNLITKYFENSNKQNIKQLRSILLLKQSKINTYNKLYLMKRFAIWKSKTKNQIPNETETINKSTIPTSTPNTLHNHKSKPKYFSHKQNIFKIKLMKKELSNSLNKEEKSWDKKERLNLKECTFNPVINKAYNSHNVEHNNNKSNNNNNISVFERLYRDKERYDTRKEMKLIETEQLKSKENTFQPNTKINNNKLFDVNNHMNILFRTANNTKRKSSNQMKYHKEMLSRSYIKNENIKNNNTNNNTNHLENINHNTSLNKRNISEERKSNNTKLLYEKIGGYEFMIDDDDNNK